MRSILVGVLFGLAVSSAALGQSAVVTGNLVSVTKTNGQVVRGRVIKELARGFLFRLEAGETVVIEFKDVSDMHDVARGAESPAPKGPAASVAPTPAPAADCFPQCRAGFSCRAGACVAATAAPAAASSSECFPQCRAGFSCRAGACVAATAAPASERSTECFPPCRAGFDCRNEVCVAGGASPARAPLAKREPPAETSADEEAEQPQATEPVYRARPRCNPACDDGQVCTSAGECEDPPEARREEALENRGVTISRERTRFLIGVGFIVLPINGATWAIAGGPGVVVPFGGSWDLRFQGVLFHVQDQYTATNGFLATAQTTKWFGRYFGIGLGTGIGYAGFTGGWSGDSGAVAFYGTPALLRFGNSVRFELSLNAGTIAFFTKGPVPWGYLGASLLL
jgi:hypothetical protein